MKKRISDEKFDSLSIEEQRRILDEEKEQEEYERIIKPGFFQPGIDRKGDEPRIRSARRELHEMGLDHNDEDLVKRYVDGWREFYKAFDKVLPQYPETMEAFGSDHTIPVMVRLYVKGYYNKIYEAGIKRGQRSYKANFKHHARFPGVSHWDAFSPADYGRWAAEEAWRS